MDFDLFSGPLESTAVDDMQQWQFTVHISAPSGARQFYYRSLQNVRQILEMYTKCTFHREQSTKAGSADDRTPHDDYSVHRGPCHFENHRDSEVVSRWLGGSRVDLCSPPERQESQLEHLKPRHDYHLG